MFRSLSLLALLPTAAFAEWEPLPRGFQYDASFERCTIDPARIDTDECAAIFRNAFLVNRAVASAVSECGTQPLDTCAIPFEDRGLPAIAARIATDSACDATPAATFPAFAPLPPDHCITMISDILRDEGVVPLDAPPLEAANCGLDPVTCQDLRAIQGTYWYQSVIELADSDLTRMRSDTAWDTCLSQAPTDEAVETCHMAALATIWADLTQAAGDN